MKHTEKVEEQTLLKFNNESKQCRVIYGYCTGVYINYLISRNTSMCSNGYICITKTREEYYQQRVTHW